MKTTTVELLLGELGIPPVRYDEADYEREWQAIQRARRKEMATWQMDRPISGGRPAWSTRSTRAASWIAMATASATWPASRPSWTTSPGSALIWDASAGAGFTSGTPWLPLAGDSAAANVATERDDPRSMLTLVRQLLELRRVSPALRAGAVRTLDAGAPDVLAYSREHGEERLLVALNLGTDDCDADLSAAGARANILCSTHLDRHDVVDLTRLALRPGEGLLLRR